MVVVFQPAERDVWLKKNPSENSFQPTKLLNVKFFR